MVTYTNPRWQNNRKGKVFLNYLQMIFFKYPLTDLAPEVNSRPGTPPTQSTTTALMGYLNDGQSRPLASSPELQSVRYSVLSSSPAPPVTGTGDQGRAENFRSLAGAKPGRRELAQMMGVDYSDRIQKTYLRGKVKGYVIRFIDMSKTYSDYSYPEVMYPIVKGCTSYMNREVLAARNLQWTRTTTQHVIHSVIGDTRRVKGSMVQTSQKRQEKRAREIAVGLEN
jgi:hypothetical protein